MLMMFGNIVAIYDILLLAGQMSVFACDASTTNNDTTELDNKS